MFDYVCSILILSRTWFRSEQADRMGFEVFFSRSELFPFIPTRHI